MLTQDLDFSAIVALAGASSPSLISLRLASARVEHVNSELAHVLPLIEETFAKGAIVSVEEGRIRTRSLPVARKRGPDSDLRPAGTLPFRLYRSEISTVRVTPSPKSSRSRHVPVDRSSVDRL